MIFGFQNITYSELKIISLVIFFFFTVLLSGVVFLFVKLKYFDRKGFKNNSEIKDLILLSSGGGYYFCYISDKQDQEISPSLVTMLGLKIGSKKFEDIEKIFELEHKNKLVEGLENLKNRKKSKIMLEVSASIQGKERFFVINGNGIENYKNNLVGVILWFFEITEYKQYLFSLEEGLTANISKQKNYEDYLNLLPFPVWVRNNKNLDIIFYNSSYNHLILENLDKELLANGKIPNVYENLEEDSYNCLLEKKEFSTSRHLVIGGKRSLYDISEIPSKENDFAIGFLIDMSKFENLKQELSDHVSSHSDLFESSSVAIAIYGKDTKLKFFNNAFIKLWLFDENWLNSKPLYQEVLENLRQRELLPKNVGLGSIHDKKDKIFTNLIKVHNEFLNLPNGKILRIIVIPHAFGGLLFSYETIHGDEALYRKNSILHYEALNSITEGALLYNRDGFLEFFNKKFVEIFQLPEVALKQKPHFSILNKLIDSIGLYNKQAYGDNLFKLEEMGKGEYIEKRMTLNDGKLIKFVIKPLSEGNIMVSIVEICNEGHN